MKLAKMLEISSFFVFQSNSVFQVIEQAELNRAFFARYGELSQAFWKAWRAEPSFSTQELEAKLSRDSARTQHYYLDLIFLRSQ